MENIGYTFCLADSELWMRISTLDDGKDYIEYVLLYVNDCSVVNEHPKEAWIRFTNAFL